MRRLVALVAACALLMAAGASGAPRHSSGAGEREALSANVSVEIRFVDVGQGDGVVLRVGSAIVVSDAGEFHPERVDAALRAVGAKQIDVAILSHAHQDHVKNFTDLLGKYHWKVKTAVLSHNHHWQDTDTNRDLIDALTSAGAKFSYVHAGEHFSWGGGYWEILNPPDGRYVSASQVTNSWSRTCCGSATARRSSPETSERTSPKR